MVFINDCLVHFLVPLIVIQIKLQTFGCIQSEIGCKYLQCSGIRWLWSIVSFPCLSDSMIWWTGFDGQTHCLSNKVTKYLELINLETVIDLKIPTWGCLISVFTLRWKDIGYFLQLRTYTCVRLLNKPYGNEVTLREQNQS